MEYPRSGWPAATFELFSSLEPSSQAAEFQLGKIRPEKTKSKLPDFISSSYNKYLPRKSIQVQELGEIFEATQSDISLREKPRLWRQEVSSQKSHNQPVVGWGPKQVFYRLNPSFILESSSAMKESTFFSPTEWLRSALKSPSAKVVPSGLFVFNR